MCGGERVGAGVGGQRSGGGEIGVKEIAHLDEPCSAARPCAEVC